MSTSSARHRLPGAAPDTDQITIHQPEWPSTTVILQNPEQSIGNGPHARWPRRILNLLLERMWWRRMGRRPALPLPATAETRSWSRNIIIATQRMIRDSARGGQDRDILSSEFVGCSAILNFMFAVFSFGNNTAIVPLWIQALWLMSFGFWALAYYIYMTRGAPARMSEGRQKWISGLTVVFTLFVLCLLQQSSVALPSIAGITTLSTAAAIWIQNLYPPASIRPRDRLNGSTELE
ncbi:hypothetical protein N431DRAFT_463025 [Stipitochalara longipes BDJ]|nr:hypothetical protein N431DRAFT_463025 [Stipitochalara longipes BDJ]